MQWAIDGDDIALSKHLLKILNPTATNLLLNLWLQWLVVVVEQLLAVEWLETTQDTLSDTADSDCANNLVFKIVRVLSNGCHVPFSTCDLLVCRHKVTDKEKDGHDDVFRHRHDIATGHLCNCDAAVGLVGDI